jgi:D-beta-D-heptose 7-phosphate kinase/D-beta-D-heptose 1-phosphate adenosyltransferase
MIENLHDALQAVEIGWQGSRILVIGDVMLDKYTWGDVNRISPEAPIPVVRVTHQTHSPGGAGNVAVNLSSLRAHVSLLGLIGDDADGDALTLDLQSSRIDAQLTRIPGIRTTTKHRILNKQQQLLRLDIEEASALASQACDELIARALQLVPTSSAVVLSDYAKGTLSDQVCQQVIVAARQRRVPVLVDPKGRSFERYRGATTICPNLNELKMVVDVDEAADLLEASRGLVKKLGLDFLIATLSERGIAIVTEESIEIASAIARQVYDVSGAGDTVIATLALSLASGLCIKDAVQLANLAAGIVVGKVGTVPVQHAELAAALSGELSVEKTEKILNLNRLLARVWGWKSLGQKIVFTNGCFDMLHVGHITLLEQARRQGDRLVVAINSDSSVRELKGPSRPIVGESQRAQVLAALSAVDAVTIFGESTPLELISTIRPDVLVKGGDYSLHSIVGAKEVIGWGGQVKVIPTVEGFSTTGLIQKALATGWTCPQK